MKMTNAEMGIFRRRNIIKKSIKVKEWVNMDPGEEEKSEKMEHISRSRSDYLKDREKQGLGYK